MSQFLEVSRSSDGEGLKSLPPRNKGLSVKNLSHQRETPESTSI
jgi:hypothetical protein